MRHSSIVRNNTTIIRVAGFISLILPVKAFIITYDNKPNAIPFDILQVYGIIQIVKNAGREFSMPCQSIFFTDDIIKTPMYINTAEVAHPGTNCVTGLKNMAIKKNIPTNIAPNGNPRIFSPFPNGFAYMFAVQFEIFFHINSSFVIFT